MRFKYIIFLFIFLVSPFSEMLAYPIDGYLLTGIRRLLRLERIQNGEIKGDAMIKGALKPLAEIKLNLYQTPKGLNL